MYIVCMVLLVLGLLKKNMSYSTGSLKRARPKDSFLHSMIRGAIAKQYVIKRYGNKQVVTKYPDMTNIIASTGQLECRNLFKEAVAFAKTVFYDEEVCAAIQKFARRKSGLY